MYVLSVVSETKSSLKPFEFPFDRGVKAQTIALLKKSNQTQSVFCHTILHVNKQSLILILFKKNHFFQNSLRFSSIFGGFLLVCEPRGRNSKFKPVKTVNIYAFF